MQLIKGYLAGGMTAFVDNYERSNEWRRYIKEKLERTEISDYYKVKITNPNDYYNFQDYTTYDSEREIMDFDINRILESDFVIVNFNDPKSIGTACELAIAHSNNIPIIGLAEYGEWGFLHPWLKNFTHKLFTDRKALVDYIINYYIN